MCEVRELYGTRKGSLLESVPLGESRIAPQPDATGRGGSGAMLRQELSEPKPMQRKIFWITFMALGLIADFALPIWWALGATIPVFCISWWVAYRSEWL